MRLHQARDQTFWQNSNFRMDFLSQIFLEYTRSYSIFRILFIRTRRKKNRTNISFLSKNLVPQLIWPIDFRLEEFAKKTVRKQLYAFIRNAYFRIKIVCSKKFIHMHALISKTLKNYSEQICYWKLQKTFLAISWRASLQNMRVPRGK